MTFKKLKELLDSFNEQELNEEVEYFHSNTGEILQLCACKGENISEDSDIKPNKIYFHT